MWRAKELDIDDWGSKLSKIQRLTNLLFLFSSNTNTTYHLASGKSWVTTIAQMYELKGGWGIMRHSSWKSKSILKVQNFWQFVWFLLDYLVFEVSIFA